jgi:plasmid maintenance system antidote protein VapI
MDGKNALPAIHPGEIIKEDILPSTGLSVSGRESAGCLPPDAHDILAARKPL